MSSFGLTTSNVTHARCNRPLVFDTLALAGEFRFSGIYCDLHERLLSLVLLTIIVCENSGVKIFRRREMEISCVFRADRIGHAYLFCGTRGTGKTSVAKIFARAVNCEHPVNGSPCGECPACKAIAAGTSMNVIEIDAASNNGVDNIREIREEVQYSPTEGKYKVYIIDEVHMLSIGAFNALLKTLEEPPAYVIFILATTEAAKIPITIMSRCQRYDFHRISIETIADRLTQLMKAENISVEDRAIKYVAKAADGSMRDALSLLDQCIAFYLGKELKYENVLDVLGAVDTEDRKSTRLNSSHPSRYRMPSSA